MATGELTQSITLGGVTVSGKATRTAGQVISDTYEGLPAAKAGTLTTRTDDNTGVATLATGHNIISTNVVDVYWDGGIRRGMVATVSVNAVTIEGGAGDNLPAQGVAVRLSKQVPINMDFVGANAEIVAVVANRRCSVEWQEADGTPIYQRDLTAGEPFVWFADSGTSNPLAAETVGKVVVSNGDTSNTCNVSQAVLYDSAA